MTTPGTLLLPCPKACGEVAPYLCWHEMADGGAHLGAWCPHCGSFIKWVPQTAAWKAAAPIFGRREPVR